jgi:hypothetical protein
MAFAIGQRVLPASSGMRLLFSTKLMFVAIFLLAVGCLLRVSSEILTYHGLVRSVWSWLPVSAITEMTAVTLFAANLLATFVRRRPSTQTRFTTRSAAIRLGSFNHTNNAVPALGVEFLKKIVRSMQWSILKILKSGICFLEPSHSQFALPHGDLSVLSPRVFANSFISQQHKRLF